MLSSSSISSSFSSNSLLSSVLLPVSPNFFISSRNKSLRNSRFNSSFPTQLPFSSSHFHRSFPKLHCAGTEVIVESHESQSGFVETGYIYSVHGLQGEVRVKASTDFPELRFSKPGKRWLRQLVSGREVIQEIELIEGRGHAGQPSWIIRFDGIDCVDKALKLVGSTMLVSEKDRPELDEDEFYTHDLVGMTVILKETGERVGTVVSVFNTGANDLLHVELNSSPISNEFGRSKRETDDSGPHAWVPFVKAIVPDVDLKSRVMMITPPKGLLELNIRSHEGSKKERRQLEWKERKKFQKRLITSKKKFCELEQQHVFDGFRYGEKSQRSLLADQIVSVNTKLLQLALQSFKSHMENNTKMDAFKLFKNFSSYATRQQSDMYTELHEKGLHLRSHGKVAVILILEGSKGHAMISHEKPLGSEEVDESNYLLVEELLNDDQMLVEIEARPFVPLVLVCSAQSRDSVQQLFASHEHFSFDPKKVWFLEEEKLPVVSIPLEEPKKHKILMKSPWEILQEPIGSGGIISLLSSNPLLDSLNQLGVEYIEVCNMNTIRNDRLALLGLVDLHKANAGLQIFMNTDAMEDNLDMIFSVQFMKKLTKQVYQLQFLASPELTPHVDKVDKEWIDIIPSSPNSLQFHSSIYSCLSSSPPDKVSLLEVTE